MTDRLATAAAGERAANPLTGVPLDRVAHLRADPAWVASAFADPRSRVVPVSEGRVLIARDHAGRSAVPVLTGADVGPLANAIGVRDAWTTVLLGVRDATAYVAVDVPAADADAVIARGGRDAAWTELRPAALTLPADAAALVAYARAMIWWHSRHRFCGVCGAATVVEEAGHVRACPECAVRHFPRTDPAVIVLVAHRADGADTRDEACLLGNQPGWPATMYSTLAGFVEPGESLEETVRRELYEEAGVRVDDVCYQSSQPWPFPQSLMVGFTARARDRAVRVDGVELRDARWFTRDQLTAALADGSVTIPQPFSISRQLIEAWRSGA